MEGIILYRVHRKRNPDNSLGHSLGYIHICANKTTDIVHVRQRLISAKFISNDWFDVRQLALNPIAISYGGNYGLDVYRRIANTYDVLFYLHPVVKPKELVSNWTTISYAVPIITANLFRRIA